MWFCVDLSIVMGECVKCEELRADRRRSKNQYYTTSYVDLIIGYSVFFLADVYSCLSLSIWKIVGAMMLMFDW